MTTRSASQSSSQKGKRYEPPPENSDSLQHDGGRPTKSRRLDSAMPPTASPAQSSSQQVTTQQPISGSRSNPIVITEDDSGHVHVQASAERPVFLQLGDCLNLALGMLPPDISRQYVFEQCLRHQALLSDTAVCAALVFDAFSSEDTDYRREPPESAAMHVPQDSAATAHMWTDTWKQYRDPQLYHFFACHSLAAEFPQFARAYVEYLFVLKGCLYQAYLALHQQVGLRLKANSWTEPKRSLAFLGRFRGSPTADPGHAHVQRELAAAVQACQQRSPIFGRRKPVPAPDQQILANTLAECLCCFTESPLDQMVSCSGEQLHQFCHDCMKRYIDTLLGDMKCRPICFAPGPDCQAPITSQELRRCLAPATLDLLLDRQAHQDIRDLNISLTECPFCEYAEELDPSSHARWFVCKNQKCAKTSCTSCREIAHMPMSCAEAQASKKKTDDTLAQRHVLEEAMTAALMRKCNKCKVPFVKIDGCNSMTCPRAGCFNKQCYVCGSNVTDYGHFGRKCTLHDTFTVEDRHQQEIHTAQEAAIVDIRRRNPSISAADLKGKQPLHSGPGSMDKAQRSKIEQALGQRVKEPEPPRHQLAARRKGTFRLNEAAPAPYQHPPPPPPLYPLYPPPQQPPAFDHRLRIIEAARLQAQMRAGPAQRQVHEPHAPYVPPAPPLQNTAPPRLLAVNERNAKNMAAIRNRLDGIPGPVATVMHHEPDSYPNSPWGRDLLQQLRHASQVELDGVAGPSRRPGQVLRDGEQNHALAGSMTYPILHANRFESSERSALNNATGFATLAARTAMRPDVVNGQSYQ